MTKMGFCSGATVASLLLLLTLTPGIGCAQWQPIGPYGGDAELVRVVPQSRGFVIAGTHNGLLFTSSNGGASWTNIPFEGQLSGTLHALEIDPRSTSTWYAGMEGDHPWTSGLYKTVDGGKSWKLLPAIGGKAVWSLALWPMKPDVIAAGTEDGVYQSLDAGANWTLISAPDNPEFRPVVSLAFDPANREIIYAGTTHLPWRTSNGGMSWESIQILFSPAPAAACTGVRTAPRTGASCRRRRARFARGSWRSIRAAAGSFLREPPKASCGPKTVAKSGGW
jgi:hypothetical protein